VLCFVLFPLLFLMRQSRATEPVAME